MTRQEERYREAVRVLREAMEQLDTEQADRPQRLKLYHAGESWLVWAWLGTPYPGALAIIPAPDGDEQEVLHGISTGTFRKVPMGEITDDGRESATLEDAEYTRHALRRLADVGGARRHADAFYVVIADAYAAVIARGDRNPVVTLAMVAGINTETMRTHIREARSRGFLTGSPGRAGGELTEAAKQLLRQMKSVEPYQITEGGD